MRCIEKDLVYMNKYKKIIIMVAYAFCYHVMIGIIYVRTRIKWRLKPNRKEKMHRKIIKKYFFGIKLWDFVYIN